MRSSSSPLWATLEEAAQLLSISPNTLRQSDSIKAVVQRRSAGKNYRNGLFWYRPDIEALIAVRRQFGLRTKSAAKLVKQGIRARTDKR
jgi:hypothetical protein